jgi:glycosyltransferase involved in cell wall biosynthesis
MVTPRLMNELGKQRLGRMIICQVLFEMPQGPKSGAAIRNEALGRALSGMGDVTTLYVQAYGKVAGWHPKRGPSFVGAALDPAVLSRVVADIMASEPDLVTVEGVYLGEVVLALQELGVPVALDLHNVESHLHEQIDRNKGNALVRTLASLRYGKRWTAARAYEASVAQAAAITWVCSDADRTLLRKIAPDLCNVTVVPNPAPDCRTQPAQSDPWVPRVLFVGHLSYEPNIAAALLLISAVFPALSSRFPAATLTLAGRAPHRSIVTAAKARREIAVVANPASLDPIYERATVAIVPLQTGGGTRLKILEAIAFGLPVVASAKAVEGLELGPDHEFLLAETPAEIVAQIERLARDPDLRKALCADATAFVQARHSPMAIATAVGGSLSKFG